MTQQLHISLPCDRGSCCGQPDCPVCEAHARLQRRFTAQAWAERKAGRDSHNAVLNVFRSVRAAAALMQFEISVAESRGVLR